MRQRTMLLNAIRAHLASSGSSRRKVRPRSWTSLGRLKGASPLGVP
jgi:hypothetical protein